MKIRTTKDNALKGTITVFLTLVLTLVASLVTAVIASARDRSMRMRCENAMDMALLSVFGEYNRELLKQFDLYFIDSSYGGENGSSYYTGERLRDYMQYDLNPAKGEYLSFSRDLFALSASDVRVTMESLATDSSGRVFKRQAIRYIKDKYGMSLAEKIVKNRDTYRQYGIEDYDPASERKRVTRELESGAEDVTDEDGNEIEYKSPVKKIENVRSGILEAMLGELEISDMQLDGSNLCSKRNNRTGSGIVACSEDLDSPAAELLYDAYLADRFSSYTKKTGKSGNNPQSGLQSESSKPDGLPRAELGGRKGLRYEMEYVLHGRDTDKQNLELTAGELLAMREAANCIYILTDPTKRNEAEGLASAAALITTKGDLKPLFIQVILYSWAFAESCIDLRTLLDGYKVPMMKTQESWILNTFADALAFKAHLRDGRGKSMGMGYDEYLQILLGLVPSGKKLERSMDIVECDIRLTPGNENFRLDNCIEFLEASVTVKSRFGNTYEIRRYFGYTDIPKITFVSFLTDTAPVSVSGFG